MEDYPSNSHKKKTSDVPDEEPKKVERIVEGQVIRRKKPLGKRFMEMFVGGDARSVGQYILFDVLLPAAKDTLADVVTQGIERTLWGEARSTSRRTGMRPGMHNQTNYQTMSRTPRAGIGMRPDPRTQDRRARATHNFDDIILPTRVEAEEVVNQLFHLIQKYESATVADLYDLVGITSHYTDDKYGWTDIRGSGVNRVSNGYLLDIPKPEPLD